MKPKYSSGATAPREQSSEFDFFELDETRLDEEWAAQPKLFFRYATKLADAKTEYEQAKVNAEIVAAEIDREVRMDPSKFDLAKPTETAIERIVTLSGRYGLAREKVIKAKHTVDTLSAVVDALEHRKRALESRVTLWVHNYYAEPHAPEGGHEAVDRMKMSARRKRNEAQDA